MRTGRNYLELTVNGPAYLVHRGVSQAQRSDILNFWQKKSATTDSMIFIRDTIPGRVIKLHKNAAQSESDRYKIIYLDDIHGNTITPLCEFIRDIAGGDYDKGVEKIGREGDFNYDGQAIYTFKKAKFFRYRARLRHFVKGRNN